MKHNTEVSRDETKNGILPEMAKTAADTTQKTLDWKTVFDGYKNVAVKMHNFRQQIKIVRGVVTIQETFFDTVDHSFDLVQNVISQVEPILTEFQTLSEEVEKMVEAFKAMQIGGQK